MKPKVVELRNRELESCLISFYWDRRNGARQAHQEITRLLGPQVLAVGNVEGKV